MVPVGELRVCLVGEDVFSTKAGGAKISNCTQCDRANFDIIKEDKELVQG